MVVRGLAVLFLSLVLALPQSGPASAAADDYSGTCVFFGNAAFKDLFMGRKTFRAALARSCDDARRIAAEAPSGSLRRFRAETHLARLERYRATLRDIFLERFSATRGGRDLQARGVVGHQVARPVSEAGAYLIAFEMGLVGAQRAWEAWLAAEAE